MQYPTPKYCIVIWSISNCDTACVLSVLGENCEFYKASPINELTEEVGVRFDHTT